MRPITTIKVRAARLDSKEKTITLNTILPPFSILSKFPVEDFV